MASLYVLHQFPGTVQGFLTEGAGIEFRFCKKEMSLASI